MSVTMGHLLSLIRSTITMSGREFTVLEHLRYEHSHMSFFFLLLVIHLVSVGSVALSFPVVRTSVRFSITQERFKGISPHFWHKHPLLLKDEVI